MSAPSVREQIGRYGTVRIVVNTCTPQEDGRVEDEMTMDATATASQHQRAIVWEMKSSARSPFALPSTIGHVGAPRLAVR
jgi:hypothetical protein